MGLGGGDAGGVQWEMLLIGPVTTVGEMMMGGHWFEMLKVQRQAGTYPSYFAAAKHMWSELGFGGFYKGFWPWGFAQGCYKGLPVLFTQGEVNRRLQEQGVEKKTASIAALRDGGTAVLYGGYDATKGGKMRPAAMMARRSTRSCSSARMCEVISTVTPCSRSACRLR